MRVSRVVQKEMYHFQGSEIALPERNGKQYIFPSFFKRVAQAKNFLYNACCSITRVARDCFTVTQ